MKLRTPSSGPVWLPEFARSIERADVTTQARIAVIEAGAGGMTLAKLRFISG